MKKGRKVITILLSVGVVAAFIAICFSDYSTIVFTVFFLLSVAALIGSMIYTLLYWRCPHCREFMPTRTLDIPTYCPHCGKKLDDEEG